MRGFPRPSNLYLSQEMEKEGFFEAASEEEIHPLKQEGSRVAKENRLENHQRAGEDFDQNKTWIENAESSHEDKPFKAIVASESRPRNSVINGHEMTGEEEEWNVERGKKIPRKPSALANASKTLLEISSEVSMVDQHFDFEDRFLEPLASYIRNAQQGEPLKRLSLHFSYDVYKNLKTS